MTDDYDRPPTLFVDTKKINPFRVLLDLHDHALGRPTKPSQRDALVELALAAAVVLWWSRWQPMTIHADLRAGADLPDVAGATGLEPARWSGGGSSGQTSRHG